MFNKYKWNKITKRQILFIKAIKPWDRGQHGAWGCQGARGGWNWGRRLGENPWSLTNSKWDVGQLALLPRPSGSSSVWWTPRPGLFSLGAGTQGCKGKADCGPLGPLSAAPVSLVRWCVPWSPAQVPPYSGPRNWQWLGLRDSGPFSNQPGGVGGALRKLGSREDLTCLTHPVSLPHTHPGSGLWLEPLDPVESLQPQL